MAITPTSLAQTALIFGFIPILLCGKRPALPRWQETREGVALAKIQSASQRGNCTNIGILTGEPSSVVVVDIDVEKGGLELWDELLAENPLEATFTVETGSGGLHYYFLFDERTSTLRNATRAIRSAGIDFKTTGGQVVFPGSIHPETGVEYAVVDGYFPETQEIIIASMPDWLFDLLSGHQREMDISTRRVRR